MKITIFGGTGFIGNNLAQKLQLKDDVKLVSLRDKIWSKNIDIETETFINLVGKAHDHKGTITEEDYYFANVILVKQIFEFFKKSNAKLLIHISSLAALEEFESTNPLTETDNCNPVSYYGKTKRQAEEWLLSQYLPNKKKLVIIRPPMVHGPGDKGNLGLLYKLISKGIPYPLSSFENERSFISMDNFVFFMEKIINLERKLQNGIYHIADDETISTKQIIALIKKIEGIKTINLSLPKKIVKIFARIGDILPLPLNTSRLKKLTSSLSLSNKKLKKDLGIKMLPRTAIEGLEITIRSFKNDDV